MQLESSGIKYLRQRNGSYGMHRSAGPATQCGQWINRNDLLAETGSDPRALKVMDADAAKPENGGNWRSSR
jgi:hypothetical protein